VVARELYDHEQDPGETKNLASDPAHRAVVAKHAHLLKTGANQMAVGE